MPPMSKSIRTWMAILLLPNIPLHAERKTSPSYSIEADMLGFSGSIDAASESGLELMSTFGGYGSDVEPSSSSGYLLQFGLWGGGNALRSAALETVLSFDGVPSTATLKIPAGAFANNYLLSTSAGTPDEINSLNMGVYQRAISTLGRMGQNEHTFPVGNRLWSIHAVDTDGNPLGQLKKAATLTLPYPDVDGDGVVDGTTPPVHASTLSLWWLDETNNLWVRLSNPTVNTTARTVSAPIWHFSVFTLMGAPVINAGEPYAYPVPFRPKGPNAGAGAGKTGTEAGGIKFTNVPSNGTIRIFTLNGGLVRELAIGNANPLNWDVKGDSGEEVGTGTYIYVIEGLNVKKTGKLTVIR